MSVPGTVPAAPSRRSWQRTAGREPVARHVADQLSDARERIRCHLQLDERLVSSLRGHAALVSAAPIGRPGFASGAPEGTTSHMRETCSRPRAVTDPRTPGFLLSCCPLAGLPPAGIPQSASSAPGSAPVAGVPCLVAPRVAWQSLRIGAFAGAIELDRCLIFTLEPFRHRNRHPAVLWPCGVHGYCRGVWGPNRPARRGAPSSRTTGLPGADHLMIGDRDWTGDVVTCTESSGPMAATTHA